MERGWTIVGVALGAKLMYLFDPDRGRRRRALLRDRLVRLSHMSRHELQLEARDLANRTRGLVASALRRIPAPPPSDDVLVARVRARIGHVVSHPHAIQVKARDGHVDLQGTIDAGEVEECIASCAHVRGVLSVTTELDAHEPTEVPERPSVGSRHWKPAVRLLAAAGGTLGIALVGRAIRRRVSA